MGRQARRKKRSARVFWMKEKPKVPHVNACAETVHKLPLFRDAKRRCLIPATGFYEWQQRDDGKQPYRFRRKDLEPFAFAAIWEFARMGGEEDPIRGDNTRKRHQMKPKRRCIVWCDMDLLRKLDGPDQWWFAPLFWGVVWASIVLVLAYYVMGV